MGIPKVISEHPVWSAVSAVLLFGVVTFPIWLVQVWGLFSPNPFAEDMATYGMTWMLVGSLYGWLCAAIGVVLVSLLATIAVTVARNTAPATPAPASTTKAVAAAKIAVAVHQRTIRLGRHDKRGLLLSVSNAGGKFHLVTRAALLEVNPAYEPADADAWEYRLRGVYGTAGTSDYQIACCDSYSVYVIGEDNGEKRRWTRQNTNPFWCRLRFEFLERIDDALIPLGVLELRVAMDDKADVLTFTQVANTTSLS